MIHHFYPPTLRAWNGTIIAQSLPINSKVYTPTEHRMATRVGAAKKEWHTFQHKSGPKQIAIWNLCIWAELSYKRITCVIANTYTRGRQPPPNFYPLRVDELLIPIPHIPHIPKLSPKDITKIKSRTLLYAITADGELFISKDRILKGTLDRSAYPNLAHLFDNKNKSIPITHAELAGLQPIYSSGQLIVKKGKMIKIDNMSGHYKPYPDFCLF